MTSNMWSNPNPGYTLGKYTTPSLFILGFYAHPVPEVRVICGLSLGHVNKHLFIINEAPRTDQSNDFTHV